MLATKKRIAIFEEQSKTEKILTKQLFTFLIANLPLFTRLRSSYSKHFSQHLFISIQVYVAISLQ